MVFFHFMKYILNKTFSDFQSDFWRFIKSCFDILSYKG